MKPTHALALVGLASARKMILAAGLALMAFTASADLAADLAAPGRFEGDRERDAARQPDKVLAYLGIRSRMTVMDLVAAGGWYTEVLSLAVGRRGTVYAQNPPTILRFRDGLYDKQLGARLAADRLSNVVRLDKDLQDVGLAPGSLDAALTALNFHDIQNRPGGAELAMGFLAQVKKLLKPGGVLGIIDHYGDADKDNTALHRLNVATALPIIVDAGFMLTSSSLLRNSADDRTTMVFAPSIRGKTDRVLYKLTKPR